MKSLEQLQKQFNLFQVGDLVKASVITRDEESIKLKTLGGCYGTLLGYIPESIEVGAIVEVVVTDIADGNPCFMLTENFVFDKVEQNALVCFAAPRSVVVEFVSRPETYGVYEPEGGLPEKFLNLKNGDKVTVSELKKGNEYYHVGRLKLGHHQPLPTSQSEETSSNLLAPWPEEKIKEVRARGSRKMHGKLKLGYIYSVTDYRNNSREVQFEDGQVGDLNVDFPYGWKRALVRVTFISQGYRPAAELIGQGEDPATETEKKPSYARKRNQDVYDEAIIAGSLERAGGYWLGYTYKVPIVDGQPYFTPTDKIPEFIVKSVAVTIAHSDVEFKDGDKVEAELRFIEGMDDPGKFIFEVAILKKF